MFMIQCFAVLIIAYIAGSFPTGYITVRLAKGEDIRKIGSGSTGATNVKRVLGMKGFLFVMIVDALKGFLPVLIINNYGSSILAVIAAVGVIIGHSKSIFLGFKGGKSVATTAGTILAMNWMVGLICFGLWAIIAYVSKYISLASIIAMIILPILMFIFHSPLSYLIYCSIAAIYVIYLHRENITRLLNGNENKVR